MPLELVIVATMPNKTFDITPQCDTIDATDAEKMTHYMLRWRTRDGSTGVWGETVSATITG